MFAKGQAVRIKSSVTKEMCADAIIPYDFPGRTVIFDSHRDSGKVLVFDGARNGWYIPLSYLESTCMFNKEA